METYTSGVIADLSHQQQRREDLLMKIMEWLDKIETQIVPQGNNYQGMRVHCWRDGPITCWNCKEEGHISRNCPEKSGADKKQTFAAVNWATKHTTKTGNTTRVKTSAPTSTSSADWLVEVRVNGVPSKCLVDTGASSTILSRSVWEQIGPGNKQLFPVKGERKLVIAQGYPLRLAGKGRVKLQLGIQVV